MFIFRRSSSCGDLKGKSLPSLNDDYWDKHRALITSVDKLSRPQVGQFGSYPTLSHPTQTVPYPYPTLPYPTLPYPPLPYPTLPYHTLPYPLPHPYPTLPRKLSQGQQNLINSLHPPNIVSMQVWSKSVHWFRR